MPDESAPSVHSGERVRSKRELEERAARAARAIREAGVEEGTTVALFLRNEPAFFEATLAALRLGAYATPINWHFTADEAGYIVRDCGARVLVAHTDLFPRIASMVPHNVPVFLVETPPEICEAYGVLPGGPARERAVVWEAAIDRHDPVNDPPRPPLTSMIYTSGTTARPKGVRRGRPTSQQVEQMGEYTARAYGLREGEPMVVLVNGPMYHSAPNSYAMRAFNLGADIVLQTRFEARQLLELIERYRVTHMHIVPTMFVRLLQLPEEVRRRYDLSSLRHVIHGAAPCSPEVKRSMLDWWGPVIFEYYGSTETGVASVCSPEDARLRPGSVGRPLPDVVVKILDDEGDEMPAGEAGNVCVLSKALPDFTYEGLPEKRREVGRSELVTVGDIGRLEDGFLYLSDRKNDMVISGGVNIAPAEIESVLIAMPGVADCAVFGVPDMEFGEALVACIVAAAAPPPDTAAVREYLAARLARYKVPKIIEFVEALPREDSGKIFKRKLRDRYAASSASRA